MACHHQARDRPPVAVDQQIRGITVAVISSFGYKGSIDATAWARASVFFGSRYAVQDEASLFVAAIANERQVTVGAGGAYGHGVFDMVAIGDTLSLPAPIATVGQWYLIALRRNWAATPQGTGLTSIVAIPGVGTTGTTPTEPPSTFPAGRADQPGVLDDQPLYWAWVKTSTTAVTLFDLRTYNLALSIESIPGWISAGVEDADIPGQIATAITAAIITSALDAANTAVADAVTGLSLLADTDPRVPKYTASDDYVEIWRDLNWRVSLAIRPDGSLFIPGGINLDAVGFVTGSAESGIAFAVADRLRRMSELRIDPAGLIPDDVLASWVSRMVLPVSGGTFTAQRVDVPEFFYDATVKTDGPVPATAETGQTIALWGNSGLVQLGGALQHTAAPGATANIAGYLQIQTIEDVEEFGFVVEFPSTGAQVAAVLPEDDWPGNGAAGGPVKCGVHYVVAGGGGDHCETWLGPGLGPAHHTGNVGASMVDGQDHVFAFRLNRSTSTLSILYPTGNRVSFTHPDMTDHTGRFFVAELYELNNGIVPAKLKVTWADSAGLRQLRSSRSPIARKINDHLTAHRWVA